mmetsp:Transcript_25633/g.50463  ORF Transcript_25633/g.50463 Transcript_25633/m.50463 type:complete len:1200 (+) Transcript_25633:62-3661(+)
MFDDRNRRNINLGGRVKTQSRQAILQKAREERAARQAEKQREVAAVTIQAFWRSRWIHNQRKVHERNAWDKALRNLTKDQPATSTSKLVLFAADLEKILRQFLFFYEAGVDDQRLELLVRTLTTSIRSASNPHNYCFHLLALPFNKAKSSGLWDTATASARTTWQVQTRELCALLLRQIAMSSTGVIINSAVMLLWLLTDTTHWPWVKQLSVLFPSSEPPAVPSRPSAAAIKNFIRQAQQNVLKYLATTTRTAFNGRSQHLLFPVVRNAILRLSVFSFPSSNTPEVPPPTAVDKTAIALLVSVALRPIALTSSLMRTQSATLSLLPDQLANTQEFPNASIKRRKPEQQSSQLHPQHQNILTTFASQFLCFILSIPLLPARLQTLGLSKLTASLVAPNIWQACMMVFSTVPDLLINGTSYSFSSFDLMKPSSSTSFVSDYPVAGWLLGNLLEMKNSSTSSNGGNVEYWQALKHLILQLPSSAFPSPASDKSNLSISAQAQHPLLLKQLNKFRDETFLNALCQRLIATQEEQSSFEMPTEIERDEVHCICVLLDALIFKWSAGSADLLNTLVFSTPIVPKLWKSLSRTKAFEQVKSSSTTPKHQEISDTISLFCSCYGHLLKILDDEDFFDKQTPLQLSEVEALVRHFKLLLLQFYWTKHSCVAEPSAEQTLFSSSSVEDEQKSSPIFQSPTITVSSPADWPPPSTACAQLSTLAEPEAKNSYLEDDDDDIDEATANFPSGSKAKKVVDRLQVRVTTMFQQLRDRQARRPFCAPETWLMHEIPEGVFMEELSHGSGRPLAVLRDIPFVLAFNHRVQILYSKFDQDKMNMDGQVEFHHGGGIRARIHRDNVLADGFEALHSAGKQLKGRVQITFVDENGNVESGIDGGGLFKEFLIQALKVAFNPGYGLFCETPNTRSLYPNPDALMTGNQNEQLQLFTFVGRLVGKAMYEGIQIEAQFANFFLRECLGHWNSVDDLESMDPDLYKNIIFLKKYDGDVADLGLTFSVDRFVYGETRTINLIPNGENIAVTKENKMRYIYLIADYYLNRQLKLQAKAFTRGMYDILDISWLHMFSSDELRLLISGTSTLDLGDLRKHTNYANGYSNTHEAIKWFWDILEEFDAATRASFLRFSTSCSRAPLLGFTAMYPKFCVQLVSAGATEDILPTSSTCMNLIRLPRYFSRARMREKLLYAISSNAGFGLT